MLKYLTPKQFCETYNTSERTAERWRVTGAGPRFVRVGPRKILYAVADCEAWAAGRTYAHRADELSRSASMVA